MTKPDQSKFSARALECLQAIGDNTFAMPLATVPWGGRPHKLARRFILQKYLTNEDLLQAFWVEEQQKRIDPDWRNKEPGLSYLAKLMAERSGGQWHIEQDEHQKTTPTTLDYMQAEWGEDTERMLAEHRCNEATRRRAAMKLVSA
jgi:hypothetical protein